MSNTTSQKYEASDTTLNKTSQMGRNSTPIFTINVYGSTIVTEGRSLILLITESWGTIVTTIPSSTMIRSTLLHLQIFTETSRLRLSGGRWSWAGSVFRQDVSSEQVARGAQVVSESRENEATTNIPNIPAWLAGLTPAPDTVTLAGDWAIFTTEMTGLNTQGHCPFQSKARNLR